MEGKFCTIEHLFTWLPGCPVEVFLIAPNPKFASKGFKIRTTPNQQHL